MKENYNIEEEKYISEKIIKLTQELLEDGYNPGDISYLLVSISMKMSYSLCDDKNKIFSNILRSITNHCDEVISESENEKNKLPLIQHCKRTLN